MSKLFILISLYNYIYISPEGAIKLEIELNLSPFSIKWKSLGNVLFNWRINPDYYIIDQPLFYLVSEKQLEWINYTLRKIKIYPLTIL